MVRREAGGGREEGEKRGGRKKEGEGKRWRFLLRN
jgi:hypothetical protein